MLQKSFLGCNQNGESEIQFRCTGGCVHGVFQIAVQIPGSVLYCGMRYLSAFVEKSALYLIALASYTSMAEISHPPARVRRNGSVIQQHG